MGSKSCKSNPTIREANRKDIMTDIMTEEEYEKFVKEGDWFLDTEAPDFREKLQADMRQRGTL